MGLNIEKLRSNIQKFLREKINYSKKKRNKISKFYEFKKIK